MILNNENLRDLYLQSLQSPDYYHGDRPAKVKRISPWKMIQPRIKVGEQLDLTKEYQSGRNIYYWSDIHFSHKNIIKYTGRPYPDYEAMNEGLITSYLNTVTANDVVVFGGDIGFGNIDLINQKLNRLPGYKIQIVGNHDMYRDGSLYDLNFDERHLCFVTNIDDCNMSFQLLHTHYPLGDQYVPENCLSVHGHIHNHLMTGNKHINICVEHTNYKPMHIRELISKARKTLSNS